jgi:hypothetical protein
MEIKYVTMPITIEQKKEYNRQGFRVIDAQFAPEGAKTEKAKAPKKEKQDKAEVEETPEAE